MNTLITHSLIAKEAARIWINADPYGRCPIPLRVVFGESGNETQIQVKSAPPSNPHTLYIFDCQWTPDSDPEDIRERLLKPLIRQALIDRGEWQSAFRTMLKNAWRCDPWPQREVLGAS